MIVSHTHRYVFLHIPKTAGTSIAVGLGLREGGSHRWIGTPPVLGRTKHHIDPALIPAEYFVFTFVRNPWDRMVSYYMFRREPRNAWRRSVHPDERRITFMEWLLRLDEFRRYRHINVEFSDAIASQSSLIRDFPQFIGRYERLCDDFRVVCRRLGIEGRPLPRANPTTAKTRHYSHYYTDEARDLVARLHADDVARFGYAFQDGR